MPTSLEGFFHSKLPVVKKPVFRMGVAGSYGIDSTDIRWAAEHGVNYWIWGRGFEKVTDGIREIIKHERENHVVSMLGFGFFGWQVRRSVENALRKLGTDYLDVFKLGWLGRTSIYSKGIIDTLLKLKREQKLKVSGRPKQLALSVCAAFKAIGGIADQYLQAEHNQTRLLKVRYRYRSNPSLALVRMDSLSWSRLKGGTF